MRQLIPMLVAAVALAGIPTVTIAQMQAPKPMTKVQFESTPTGSPVQVMVRVVSIERDTLRADLLDQIDESRYKPSGTRVELYYSAGTPIVMGSSDDVNRVRSSTSMPSPRRATEPT